MAQVIDTRSAGGEFVVLGDALTLPSSSTPTTPSQGSLRFNPLTNAVEQYLPSLPGWRSLANSAVPAGGPFVPTTGNTIITGNITINGALTIVGNIVGDYFTGTSEYAVNVGIGPGSGASTGGGGPGSFGAGSGGGPSSGDVSDATVIADGTVVARDLGARFGEVLNLKDFGAAGDGQTDDTLAISQWWTQIVNSTLPGYVPAGVYVVTQPLVWDMMTRTTGVTILGAGCYNAIFNLNAVATSPAVQFMCSSGGTAYNHLTGIGFAGSIAGTVLQIGQANFSDPMDSSVFDLAVINGNSGNGAIAVAVNLVRASSLTIAAQSGGAGEAIRINALAASDVFGSFSNGLIGVHLTNGASTGNNFQAITCRNVATCVVIDSAGAAQNTFIGGSFQWSQAAINASAGTNNIFLNPNFKSNSTSVIASGVGVTTTDAAVSLGYAPLNSNGGTMFGAIVMSNTQPIQFANSTGTVHGGVLLDNTNTLRWTMDDGSGNARTLFAITEGPATSLNFGVPLAGSLAGNAATASKFANAVTLSFTGDVQGNAVLDGSQATVLVATALSTPINPVATYSQVSIDAHGRVVSGTNALITLQGAVTGSGSGTITTSLANSGVIPATYFLVAVDATGRVTHGQAGVAISNGAVAFANSILFDTSPQPISLSFQDSMGNPNTGLVFSSNVLALTTSDGHGAARTIFSIAANSTNSVLMIQTEVEVSGLIIGAISQANKWSLPITLSLAGDASGATMLDGSANEAITVTLAPSGVAPGTYSQVVVDAKGRVITGANAISNLVALTLMGVVANATATLAIDGGANFNLVSTTSAGAARPILSFQTLSSVAPLIVSIPFQVEGYNGLLITPPSQTGQPVQISTTGFDPQVTLAIETSGGLTWNGNTIATVNTVAQQISLAAPVVYTSNVANLSANAVIGASGYALDGRKPAEYGANTVGSGVPVFYGYADAANLALNVAVWLSTIDALPVQN